MCFFTTLDLYKTSLGGVKKYEKNLGMLRGEVGVAWRLTVQREEEKALATVITGRKLTIMKGCDGRGTGTWWSGST